MPRFVYNAKMADCETAHSADGKVDERVCRHYCERFAHQFLDRTRERLCTMRSNRPQPITLRDDADVLRQNITFIAFRGTHEQR
jgi:hypothetical protein